MNYKEIKSYEDACKVLGIQPISDNAVAAFPAEDRKSMLAYHKLTIIARAINGGWKPDWNNTDQYKYYPVFYYESAGLSCANTVGTASHTNAYIGSRLCFKTEAMSDYAAATFADLYTDFYCLPASVEKGEDSGAEDKPDFLKAATEIIETRLQPLAQEKKTRGVVLIACDTDTTDEKGESETGAIIGIVGNGKALAHGVAELMTQKQSAPLVKQATELIAMQRLQERINQEGAKFLAELLTQQEK